MIDLELAADLLSLADAIARMRPPQNHNPDAFHEDRSELAGRARRLAERCRTNQPPAPADVPGPVGRQVTARTTRHIGGRTVLVLNRRQSGAEAHPFY